MGPENKNCFHSVVYLKLSFFPSVSRVTLPPATSCPDGVLQKRTSTGARGDKMSSTLGFMASFRPVSTISLMHKDAKFKRKSAGVVSARYRKPLEELYNVRVERKTSTERLEKLEVSRWSVWKTGKCKLPWDWHVDQQVYITKGSVKVFPEGCKECMVFNAGDLVRYPKWFEADLQFDGPYEEHYRFRAYGDD